MNLKTIQNASFRLAAFLWIPVFSWSADVDVKLTTTDGSTQFVITNSIGGVLTSIDSVGNVGLGTTAPAAKLDSCGSMVPCLDLSFNLGYSTRQWLNGYFGSLYTGVLNASTTTISGPLTVNSTATFNGSVIYASTPSLPLTQNYFYIGSASNLATEFAPGANSTLLSVVSGTPTWVTSNSITVASATYATTSTSATYATTAGSALTATTATYALTAGTASYADTALLATSATFATTSTSATYATTAGSAVTATSATFATTATSATYATTAGSAVTATSATFATTATSATYATTAGSALTATTATYALTAGTASYATMAGSALTATTSTWSTHLIGGAAGSLPYQFGTSSTTFLGIGTSGYVLVVSTNTGLPEWSNSLSVTVASATYATTALTASSATFATTATSATYATTAGSAVTATSATFATTATSATYATNAGTATWAYHLISSTSGIGVIPYQVNSSSTGYTSVGINGQVLSLVSGVPSWITIATGGGNSSAIGGLQNRVAKFQVDGSTITSGSIVDLAASTSIYITAGGNVGIGNTNGAQALDVTGAVQFSGALLPGGSAGTSGYLLVSSGTSAAPQWINPSGITIGSATFATTASSASFATTASSTTFATTATSATYATNAGTASYATTAGSATYATTSGSALTSTTSTWSTHLIGGAAGSLPYQFGTSSTTFLGIGTNGYVLTVSTTTGLPSWSNDLSGVTVASATYATTALTASSATFATTATSATYATTAGSAVTATSATFATTATSATYATTAGSALTATTATYATTATSATYATTAGSALTATTATYALTASTANYALTAGTASYATMAGSALTATTSTWSTHLIGGAAGSLPYQFGTSSTTFLGIGTNGYVLTVSTTTGLPSWSNDLSGVTVASATYATTALTASSATFATTATSATYATTAGSAVTATSATFATTATSATYATTAGSALTATTATYATTATSATYATTAGSALTATTATYALTASTANYALTAGTASYATMAGSALTATTSTWSTHLIGGAAGSLPYQFGTSSTTFLGIGTNGYVLTVSTTTGLPSWSNDLSGVTVASATYATTALTASSATFATTATSATYATTAGSAVTATSATFATTATSATYATTAGSALTATTATYALTASTANYALTAGTASYATMAGSALTATTSTWSTHLIGGAAGSLPYQFGTSSTTFLGIGTNGYVLTVSTTTGLPSWSNDLSGVTVASATYATTALTASSATFATTATSATYATTAGSAVTATSATFATTATSATYATTAGSALTATTATYALTASTANYALTAGTASYATMAGSALTATTSTWSTHLIGGAAGSLPYQFGTSSTTFLGIGTNGYVLTVSTTTGLPSWSNDLSGVTVASATYATTALTASSATFATTATSATYATTAGSAVTATSATFATTATSATYATTAGSALTATTATYALTASTANYALTAGTASYATMAGSALTATTSTWSTHLIGGAAGSLPYQFGTSSTTFLGIGTNGYVLTVSTTTGLPSWSNDLSGVTVASATYASTASTATYALTASTANYANTAGTATYAFTASTANYANTSATATYATSVSTSFLNTSAWLLNGNSGTGGSNFLGTTDAQSLSFRTNNSTAVFISSSGWVGVGATSLATFVNSDIATYALNVRSTEHTRLSVESPTDTRVAGIRLRTNNNGTLNDWFIDNRGGVSGATNLFTIFYGEVPTGGSAGLTISSSGYVGVGTPALTPVSNFKLQVAGDVGPNSDAAYDLGSSSLRWRSLHVSSGSVVVHKDTTNTNKLTLDFNGSYARVGSDSASPMQLSVGSSTPIYISTSGQLGVWAASPAPKYVSGDASPYPFFMSHTSHNRVSVETTGDNSIAGFRFVARTTENVDWYIDNRGGFDGSGQGDLTFSTDRQAVAGTLRTVMHMYNNGAIVSGYLSSGMPTLSSNDQFMVHNSTTHARMAVATGANNSFAGIRLNGRTTTDVNWTIDNRGGSETPNSRLAFYNDGTERAYLTTAGAFGVTSLPVTGFPTALCYDTTIRAGFNVLVDCTSSQRFKENVKSLTLGLQDVLNLRPVTFDWKSSHIHDVGFIAEEVEKVDPLLVTYKNGEILGVKYEKLSTVLVNAIKELHAENQALKQVLCKQFPNESICQK